MRTAAITVALCLVLITGKAFAVQVETSSASKKDVALVEPESSVSFEFDADGTYVGSGDVKRGTLRVQNFDETDAHVHYILTPRVKIGILRLGMQAEHYSFGFPHNSAIPDVLESTALVIGLDPAFS